MTAGSSVILGSVQIKPWFELQEAIVPWKTIFPFILIDIKVYEVTDTQREFKKQNKAPSIYVLGGYRPIWKVICSNTLF